MAAELELGMSNGECHILDEGGYNNVASQQHGRGNRYRVGAQRFSKPPTPISFRKLGIYQ